MTNELGQELERAAGAQGEALSELEKLRALLRDFFAAPPQRSACAVTRDDHYCALDEAHTKAVIAHMQRRREAEATLREFAQGA